MAVCVAELRSWVVAGRGRHLYLELRCPPPYEGLSGRVEFTSLSLRPDYVRRADASGSPRLARMAPGVHLGPPRGLAPAPDNRLVARFWLTPGQAACLQRQRVFSEAYVLLGPNSNSAMRHALESCGCGVPDAVLRGGGVLGEFPGIDTDPGEELPAWRWPLLGLPTPMVRGVGVRPRS